MDALDRTAVTAAVLDAKPDVVINELTALSGLASLRPSSREASASRMLNMATSRIILTVLLWAVVGVLVVTIIKGMRADQSWPQMVITAVSVTVVGSFITLRRAGSRQRN